MKWWRLATFIPASILLLKYTHFPGMDQRAWPGIVFICFLLALLVTGAVGWLVTEYLLS